MQYVNTPTETHLSWRRKQLFTLVFDSAVLAGILWLWGHPDATRRLHMQAVMVIRRSCYGGSDRLRQIADHAGTYYNNLRNVNA